ncbi:MAG: tetratricopeptide repeat protein [Oscillospiraceae bacterium]|nr:tetratricopeptide repeat protein [Oscillospiraceae bacterium]
MSKQKKRKNKKIQKNCTKKPQSVIEKIAKFCKKPHPIVNAVVGIVSFVGVVVMIIANIVIINGNNSDITYDYSVEENLYNPVIYVHGDNAPDLSEANEYYSKGQEFFRMGDYDNTLERYTKALDEYEDKPVNVDKARIQYAIGIVYNQKGNLKEAIQWYSDAIGTLNSLKESAEINQDEIELEEIKNELSYNYYLRGNAYVDDCDLERAMLDLYDCYNYLIYSSNAKCTYSSALCLHGRIYMASYYGTHSQYPVHGGTDLGVSWFDAMYCFDDALENEGMRLRFVKDRENGFSGSTAAVKAYKYADFNKKANLVFDLPDFGEECWIIENPDAETAMILNLRAKLLMMIGIGDESSSYLDEAEVNSKIALQIYNDLPSNERNGIQDTYYNLSQIALIKGNVNNIIDSAAAKASYDWLDKALDYTRKWCGRSKSTAIVLDNIGMVYLMVGDCDSAKESFLEAQSIFDDLGLAKDAAKQNEFLEFVENYDPDGKWELVIQ